MSNYKVFSNVDGLRDMTDVEKAQYDKDKAKDPSNEETKLYNIRQLRNQKLSETDYLATSDNVMSNEMKAFRKSMRDIPQDYSEADYDDLLARDEQGNLTHSVWSKP
jgi:predicted RND superfamily exporter protein